MTQSFMGNVSKDIDEFKEGMYSFNLAYNPPGKDKDTIFIRCVMFSGIAIAHKNMIRYFTKGSRLLVTGSITEIKSYINKNNEPASSVSLTVHNVQFLPKSKSQEEQEISRPNTGARYPLHEANKKDAEAEAADSLVRF